MRPDLRMVILLVYGYDRRSLLLRDITQINTLL